MLSEINTLVMDWSTFVVEMFRHSFYVCGIKKCFILFCGLGFILSLASQMQGGVFCFGMKYNFLKYESLYHALK